MTLQTSGGIRLDQIQTEFGGSNPISLSEYYRGGSYVHSSITAVPASGAISLSNFYGTSAVWSSVITEGNSGSFYGYLAGSFGSMSNTSYNGATVTTCYYHVITVKGSTSYAFRVRMSGSRAQNFFSNIYGIANGLATSNASSYSATSTETSWLWSITQQSTWDGSGTQTVYIT